MSSNQAKWAISKMLEAGWKRNEFSVRTERTQVTSSSGQKYTEYGDANIRMKVSTARQIEMIGEMVKAGLKITVVMKHRPMFILISDRHNKPSLQIMDMLTDDYMKRWITVPVVIDTASGHKIETISAEKFFSTFS